MSENHLNDFQTLMTWYFFFLQLWSLIPVLWMSWILHKQIFNKDLCLGRDTEGE